MLVFSAAGVTKRTWIELMEEETNFSENLPVDNHITNENNPSFGTNSGKCVQETPSKLLGESLNKFHMVTPLKENVDSSVKPLIAFDIDRKAESVDSVELKCAVVTSEETKEEVAPIKEELQSEDITKENPEETVSKSKGKKGRGKMPPPNRSDRKLTIPIELSGSSASRPGCRTRGR